MVNEMMRAEVWLQEHLNSQQGINDLADRLGYSTSQVRRRFKQCFGLSPGSYRDILRLERAARLLALTPLGIAAIAARCGYRNHSAFSRAFQRHFQQSPRQYRTATRERLFAAWRDAHPLDFTIHHGSATQALVRRVYHPPSEPARFAALAAESLHALPPRLAQAPTVAVLHDLPLPTALARLDLGVTVSPAAASDIAPPLAYRHLSLPAAPQACAWVDSLSDVSAAVAFLIGHGLPQRRLSASGEPPRLHWHPQGLEVRLPLLEAPAGR